MLKESRWTEKSILDNPEEFQQIVVKEKDPTKETEIDLSETLQKNQECSATEVKGTLFLRWSALLY